MTTTSPVPEWVLQAKVGDGTVKVDGNVHMYHILSRELEPRLPGFLGFPNGEVLFLSEDVPESYRPYVLAHEVREFTVHKDSLGRCKTSLLLELADVPPLLLPEYLRYRLDFFRRLVAYYAASDKEAFKAEIAMSLAYLEKLTA